VYLQKGFEKPANDGTIRNPSFLLSKAVIGWCIFWTNTVNETTMNCMNFVCKRHALVKQDEPHIPAIVDLCLRYIGG
jgi:hypothetical protein